MRRLHSTPKGHTTYGDKLCPPGQTVVKVKSLFANLGGLLAESRRTDTGRLGIPVYLSICGPRARALMPTRKQMGKGASPDQAEASALMELAERYSYFSFWANPDNFTLATWSQAEALWPGRVMPLERILQSVGQDLPLDQARQLMDLVVWRFAPATEVLSQQIFMTPMDWFRKLNEFNGSSAGNCLEESILQGACELVERHVCALVDRGRLSQPNITVEGQSDPVLANLVGAFESKGIRLWLKDFSLGLPAPTVGALAYDPSTFPLKSEIVFTAGTATSPAKAAVRAVTEVAQLAGDFETGSNYEASGLCKFTSLQEASWLTQGPTIGLSSLPDLEAPDMFDELSALTQGLGSQGFQLYTVETTHPELGVAANYSFVPGFQFRERSPRASLGLFVGRILAEEAPLDQGATGLDILEEVMPGEAYLPFFRGLLSLRQGQPEAAGGLFAQASVMQPEAEDEAMAVFYQGYSASQAGRWEAVEPLMSKAIALSAEVKEYHNLRGVARFKSGRYAQAAEDFEAALRLDSGSAMDLANLGLCHKFMGHGQAAREFLTQALEMDPALDFVRAHLGELQP